MAGIEILKNGKYSCLKRTSDNYFVGDGLGKVAFPMTVRVTAVTGEQREAVLPSMQNDNNILSNVQFSGFGAGGTFFGPLGRGEGRYDITAHFCVQSCINTYFFAFFNNMRSLKF